MTDHNIDDFATNLCRPGGQVEDEQGNEMNDPGVATGHLHMAKLKQLVYYCNYCRINDRTIDADIATLDRIAFDKLSAEYAPTSITAYIEMKSEYTERVLVEGENPTIWLSELDRMKKRPKDMKHPIDEIDDLTDIIGNLPLKY